MNHKERGERVRQTVMAHGGRLTGHRGGVVTFQVDADIDTLDLGDMKAMKIGAGSYYRVELRAPKRRAKSSSTALPSRPCAADNPSTPAEPRGSPE